MSDHCTTQLEHLTAAVAKMQATIENQQAEIQQLRQQISRSENHHLEPSDTEEGSISGMPRNEFRRLTVNRQNSLRHILPNHYPPKPAVPIGRKRLLKRVGSAVAMAALLGASVPQTLTQAADPVGDDALRGVGSNNRGVRGSSQNSDGVLGESEKGYGGVFRGGQAPLRLIPASGAGAPTVGTHQVGELWVDAEGKWWICTKTGTFGTTTVPIFVAVATVNSNQTGLSFVLLPQPVRMIGIPTFEKLTGFTDTGYDPVTVNKFAKLYQITDTPNVPKEAKAVLGIAVVINPANNGNLRVYRALPEGSPAPIAISIAFRASQVMSHNVTTALSSDGKLAVSSSSDCNFTFDVIGYYV